MTLPNFLVIGAQKTGTKWLHRNLSRHPDFFVPYAGNGLEVHYFDSRHYGDPAWYRGHFAPVSGEAFIGDITPGYCAMAPVRVMGARQLLPDARIIYTLRNPKDRAVSAARMEIGGLTFKGNPRKTILTPESSDEDVIEFCTVGEGYLHGDYLTQLDNWEAAYPPKQLLVLSYDHLVRDAADYLTCIYRFLGAEPQYAYDLLTKRVHVSRKYPLSEKVLRALDETYDPVIERLQARVAFDISAWLEPVEG